MSLTLSIVSLVLSVVAVYVTAKIGLIADRSLKNSTTVGLAGVSQILRYMERRDHGSPDEAMEMGADVWTCEASPESVQRGEAVALRLDVFGSSSPHHTPDESGLVRCTVTMPSGARVFANATPSRDEGYECYWVITFPAHFRDNRRELARHTNSEGVYIAEWDGLPGEQTRTTVFTVTAARPGWREVLRDLRP